MIMSNVFCYFPFDIAWCSYSVRVWSAFFPHCIRWFLLSSRVCIG